MLKNLSRNITSRDVYSFGVYCLKNVVVLSSVGYFISLLTRGNFNDTLFIVSLFEMILISLSSFDYGKAYDKYMRVYIPRDIKVDYNIQTLAFFVSSLFIVIFI